MAEINLSNSRASKGRGVQKSKKLSTRVDLTPMVDLGFLLITFFIFTTTMSEPTTMSMYLPDDSGELTPIKKSGALTILIGSNSSVSYYEGEFRKDGTNLVSVSINQLRDALIKKKRSVAHQKDFVVMIKPSANCVYKDLVNVLDEMTISDVKRYSLIDITEGEESILQ